MSTDLYVFDDGAARGWAPFSLTRPVGELLYGCFLLRARAEAFWGLRCRANLSGTELLGFEEAGAPAMLVADEVDASRPRVLFSSRAVPLGTAPELPKEGATLLMEGEVVGWLIPPGGRGPSEEQLAEPGRFRGGPEIGVPGAVLRHPWDLVAGNPDRLLDDLPRVARAGDAALPAVRRIGEEPVYAGHDVEIEPGVVLDTRNGPIALADGVRVQAPARLEGPLYVGRGSTVLGGSVGSSSIGPLCKVRGEVEASILLGYDNKAHDGFLGHAYLGRWVNLGAFTTNSDLKNDYGNVRIPTGAGEVDSGTMKLGCFLGDHVKTGIGTLLNTGTVVGAGSNVFGGLMPPKWVPAFSWGAGADLAEYRLDRFLAVAERAMSRRDVPLSEGMRELLARAWERSRADRAQRGQE